MSVGEVDGLTQALVAHRILEEHDLAVGDRRASEPIRDGVEQVVAAVANAEEDEQRLDRLVELYRASKPTAPSRAGRSPRPMWVAVGLAAAVLLTVALRGALHDPTPLGTRYEVELSRELALVRGSDTAPSMHTYRADRTIEIWLRPVDALESPVEAVVYARRRGERRRLDVQPVFKDNGVVHIEATVEEAGLSAGEWELLLIVGWPGELPRIDDEIPEVVDVTELPYDVRTVQVLVVPTEESASSR